MEQFLFFISESIQQVLMELGVGDPHELSGEYNFGLYLFNMTPT
jgi:hypothetical protein